MLLRSCKIEVVSFPCMKVPRLEFLTCLKVVSRRGLDGLKRKTSLSKGTLKRKGALKCKTAEIFVSRLLELSLQKFVYLMLEVLCDIYQVCMTTSRKGASPDLLQHLDQEKSLWRPFPKRQAGKLSYLNDHWPLLTDHGTETKNNF